MYREVTMVELKEVLRLWGEGVPKKRLAAQLGLDPKTVRRYLRVAASTGWRPSGAVSDEQVRDVLLAVHPVDRDKQQLTNSLLRRLRDLGVVVEVKAAYH